MKCRVFDWKYEIDKMKKKKSSREKKLHFDETFVHPKSFDKSSKVCVYVCVLEMSKCNAMSAFT